jgi:chemosensory pili system protein ChpC
MKMAAKEIRTILAPLTNGHVLLPNSVVAEIMDYTPPEPLKKAPAWLLGELAWHGWQVPVISYLRLINIRADDHLTKKSRILLIKTLGESTQVNYIGLLIQGLPRLKTVTPETLIEQKGENLPNVVFSNVMIDELPALIPEIAQLTGVVEHTAYGS